MASGVQLLVRAILAAPILLAYQFRRLLSLLAIAFAVLAVLFAWPGPNQVPTSLTTAIPSVQTSVEVPDVVVAGFSVTDDLSTALVGLGNAGGVTFLGPSGSS